MAKKIKTTKAETNEVVAKTWTSQEAQKDLENRTALAKVEIDATLKHFELSIESVLGFTEQAILPKFRFVNLKQYNIKDEETN